MQNPLSKRHSPNGVDAKRPAVTQGSSCLATLICCLDMDSLTSFMINHSVLSMPWGCSLACCCAAASAASRSATAGQGAGVGTATAQCQRSSGLGLDSVAVFPWPFCFSCGCKNMRPTLLCNGGSVACASSFNPRMAFGQSVAQPEPRTPGAPNSNRCQSAGDRRQLV
jgi:hypothetical protein